MTVITADSTVVPEDLGDDLGGAPVTEAEPLVEEDLLVEDVSIDGMCGVY